LSYPHENELTNKRKKKQKRKNVENENNSFRIISRFPHRFYDDDDDNSIINLTLLVT